MRTETSSVVRSRGVILACRVAGSSPPWLMTSLATPRPASHNCRAADTADPRIRRAAGDHAKSGITGIRASGQTDQQHRQHHNDNQTTHHQFRSLSNAETYPFHLVVLPPRPG